MKELINIISELKAPKGQYNQFGKYKYRSCEDILEAVKPLCVKNKVLLTITDDIVLIGDRYYVKATATVSNIEGASVSASALAREEDTKKGMDGSQVTGASSSYARKYALNGLFCIDDTKDSDATNKHEEQPQEQPKEQPKEQSKPSRKFFEDALQRLQYCKTRSEVFSLNEEFKLLIPEALLQEYKKAFNSKYKSL